MSVKHALDGPYGGPDMTNYVTSLLTSYLTYVTTHSYNLHLDIMSEPLRGNIDSDFKDGFDGVLFELSIKINQHL